MDFVLKRKGGVPLHDQLLAQLELRILSGALAPGQRLPSVRALARRLGLHANTVSSAYRDLEAAGHVELRRGAGVFVRRAARRALEEARGLDEMIRLALRAAFRMGHSGTEIRAAVERWLRAAPPERVVMVDPSREMVELLVHEMPQASHGPPRRSRSRSSRASPSLVKGTLVLVLPYYVEGGPPDRPLGRRWKTVTRRRARRRSQGDRGAGARGIVLVVSPRRRCCPSPPCSCAACAATRCWSRRARSRPRASGAACSRPRTWCSPTPWPPPRCARPTRAPPARAAPPRRAGPRARSQGARAWPRPRPRRILRLIIPSTGARALLLAGATSGFSPRALWDAWPTRRVVPTPAPCLRHGELVERLRSLAALHRGRSRSRRSAAPSKAATSSS